MFAVLTRTHTHTHTQETVLVSDRYY